MQLKQIRGFTLVEMMVTVLISSIMVSTISLMFITGSRSWQTNKTKIEIQQNLRTAMERMKEDLSQASSTSIIDVPADDSWYTSINFRLPESIDNFGNITWPTETIEYYLDGTSPKSLMRLIDDEGTPVEDRVITENIQTLEVRRLAASANIIEIKMQAQKTAAMGITVTANNIFKVKLHN